ncbi:MAG: proteasome subunit beta [Candidatus Hadarchaeales archaeon]
MSDLKPEEKIKKFGGTTTVGLVCSDGTVLACDSRATAGYLIASKEARKIYKISEHIAVTVAGAVGDAEKLVEVLTAEAGLYRAREGREIEVLPLSRIASLLLNSQYLFPYIVNLLVGGYDSRPRLFFIDLDGTLTEERMTATGSGSPTAYGILEKEYREGMKVEEALPLAVNAVRIAMRRDIATGNEIRAATITSAGVSFLTPDEIKKLV